MRNLNKQDLKRAVKLLPNEVKSLCAIHGKELVIAGGFLRSVVERSRIKDIDLFPLSHVKPSRVVGDLSMLTTNLGQKADVITTVNACSFKNIGGRFVQIIHRWQYSDPEELLKSFDFKIACAGLWYNTQKGDWESLVDDYFYEDVAAKRLTFQFPDRQEDIAGSLLRVLKFNRQGYNISSENLAGVIARIAVDARKKDLNKMIPGTEAENYSEEKSWTRIIHNSIATVTGES